MALNKFPFEAYLQASNGRDEKDNQIMQDLLQTSANIGGIFQGLRQNKAKKGLSELMAKSSQQTPQGLGPNAGPVVPNFMQQAMPYLMQLDPQGTIKSMMAQNDPYKQSEMHKNQAMTDLYKARTGVVGQESPWVNVPGMLSPNGEPIERSKISGEYRVVPMKAVPTGRGNAAFGTDAVTWANATPEQKAMAERIYKGDVRVGDLSYRDRSIGVNLANEYATQNNLPPFQSYSGDVKRGMAENLAYGKMGMNALSLNTAIGHAKSASDAFIRVQNTNTKWLNQPINELRKNTHDPNIIKLDTTLNALNGELATVFKGSNGTDTEIGKWQSVLSSDLTPSQAQAAIQQVTELLNSRLSAMRYQQQNVMGGRPADRQLLSPKAEKIDKSLGSGQGNVKSFDTIQAAENAGLPKGTRVKIGDRMATVQ